MQFLLNGLYVQSPHVLLSTCEVNGIDTSLWLGKANSFVDVRGVDPSYGYFLIDYEILQLVTTLTDRHDGTAPGQADTGVTPTGSYKLQLTVVTDELVNPINPAMGYKRREVSDLFIKSCINVTPSLSGEESTYLIHLVDARYVFSSQESSNFSRYTSSDHQWFNKVEAYLNPDDAKIEYELVEAPEYGIFIYDETTVEDLAIEKIGETEDGTEVRIPKPRPWAEILYEALNLFTGNPPVEADNDEPTFPYFAPPEQPLVLNIPLEVKNKLPKYIPQDLCTKYTSGRDFIYKLLYWTNTSLIYLGNGEFNLISVESEEKTIPGTNIKQTDFDELLTLYGNPSDIKFHSLTQDESIPTWLAHQYPKIDTERENNEIDEYKQALFYVESTPAEPLGKRITKKGSDSFQVTMPIVYVSDRLPIDPLTAELPKRELINDATEGLVYWFRYQTKRIFGQYPKKTLDFTGFLDIRPSSFVERVTLRDLGDGPYTLVENIKDIEWDLFAPTPIIPREQKFGVILAKCKEVVSGEDTTFEFEDPKILVGAYPTTYVAYNTRRQNYLEGEEVILIHGQAELWRSKSRLADSIDPDADLWFTIDADPLLTLKLEIAKLEEIGTSGVAYRYPLDDAVLVNGEMPREDPDLPEAEVQYITITNKPTCKWDDDDVYIYAAYDATVGTTVRDRWTFGDAFNDIYFLKGLPGYVKNPEEPTTEERRLVLKSPFSASQSIGWLEEAADGRTDEELEQFIITIIQEQGGTGGGTGGNTTMMKGFVNKAGGVAGTETTFNFHNAVVLISDGTVQPDNGACDNSFATPFVHNEPILLLKKNNGVWTAIKIQRNLIAARPSGGTLWNATTFALTNITAIVGTAPDTAVAKGDGQGYLANEDLILEQTDDNKWRVIHRLELSAMFRTTSTIGAATYNDTTGIMTTGAGFARKYSESTTIAGQFSTEVPTTLIRNMTGTAVGSSKNIQCKKIGRYWFVDVENCS